jgi:hypothetical protein
VASFAWLHAISAAAVGASLGCAPAHSALQGPGPGRPPDDAADAPSVDIAKAREKGLGQAFTWNGYDATSFAKAKAEHRYILIDGAAEWCHWCHVMDETTYRDPAVGRLIREKFVAIRVDIDARPDLAERYGEWGWPATILLSPDAEEVGKFRGYIPPDRLRATLDDVLHARAQAVAGGETDLTLRPSGAEALSWVASRVTLDLDEWWDPAQGGWGSRQKAPIGANVEFEVVRASHGDAKARARALFTIEKQRALLDPVWGGVYQYSAGSDWTSPHFEKLMTVQAASIEAGARAYMVTKDAGALADARAVARYLDAFLSAPDGGLYANQDADVGAHDPRIRFVDGATYYAKGDAARRALGVPWVDTHVYGRENGVAIAALAMLFDATRDASVLARVEKAADRVLATHVLADGTVLHDPNRREGPFFLADAATLGRGLARLAEVTGRPDYRAAAAKVVRAMAKTFADPKTGGLFEASEDPNAAGVFGRRNVPFTHGVVAARALARVGALEKDVTLVERAKSVLGAVATPVGLRDQGRWVGEFLLALDEVGVVPW